ncbi:toprim domain-containing protein [Mucilaginibacter lacusdianchii]|uniref:toprim domain-containing protein n=1 Tax=Mucilaginibacter lacusdianchii TaxID=2684211 RepID=UPI00131D2798|nr:toprim domain-containing protein [Mucilaginibacter sp. JXJ CY 39]
MTGNYSAQEIREQLSPVDLLARLGHHPAYKSGKELFYHSMLRVENTPSFCIDDNLGVWYDHGGANPSGIKGGNVIDLALAYWYPLTFREVLEKINEVCNLSIKSEHSINNDYVRPRKATKIPHYRISEIKALGNNPAITAYLQKRGVWPVAHELFREVYYFVEDEKKLRKHFFSAGWQNENGGWEVNNPYFKGCFGPKGLTVIPGDSERLVIFEAMMDYLSWKFEQENTLQTALILNGVTFVEAAIHRAADYPDITVFFDNDDAGKMASQAFLKALPETNDGSTAYSGFKDYNAMRMNELDALYRVVPERQTGFFDQVKVGFSR